MIENIEFNDVKELYNSLLNLDIETFNEEIEVVMPFERYLDDAKNAPRIIQVECEKILSNMDEIEIEK